MIENLMILACAEWERRILKEGESVEKVSFSHNSLTMTFTCAILLSIGRCRKWRWSDGSLIFEGIDFRVSRIVRTTIAFWKTNRTRGVSIIIFDIILITVSSGSSRSGWGTIINVVAYVVTCWRIARCRQTNCCWGCCLVNGCGILLWKTFIGTETCTRWWINITCVRCRVFVFRVAAASCWIHWIPV